MANIGILYAFVSLPLMVLYWLAAVPPLHTRSHTHTHTRTRTNRGTQSQCDQKSKYSKSQQVQQVARPRSSSIRSAEYSPTRTHTRADGRANTQLNEYLGPEPIKHQRSKLLVPSLVRSEDGPVPPLLLPLLGRSRRQRRRPRAALNRLWHRRVHQRRGRSGRCCGGGHHGVVVAAGAAAAADRGTRLVRLALGQVIHVPCIQILR